MYMKYRPKWVVSNRIDTDRYCYLSITYKSTNVSDQPAHRRRLASAFAACIHKVNMRSADSGQNLDLWPCWVRHNGSLKETFAHMQ